MGRASCTWSRYTIMLTTVQCPLFIFFYIGCSDVVFSQSGSVFLLLCLSALPPASYLGHIIPLDRHTLNRTSTVLPMKHPLIPSLSHWNTLQNVLSWLKICFSHEINKKLALLSPTSCLILPYFHDLASKFFSFLVVLDTQTLQSVCMIHLQILKKIIKRHLFPIYYKTCPFSIASAHYVGCSPTITLSPPQLLPTLVTCTVSSEGKKWEKNYQTIT